MVRQHWTVVLPALVQAAQAVVAVPGVVHLPVQARHDSNTLKRSAPQPRPLTLSHDQEDITAQSYEVTVSVGTPPQKMKLGLEVSKSETWLISDGVFALCDGCDDGYFQINKSKTVSPLLGYGTAEYGDPTTIPPSNVTFDLDLHKDTFEIGHMSIPQQTFGVLTPGPNKSYNGLGIIGLGPNLEHGYEAGKPYNTVLDSLAAQGYIASRTYSLDLRSYDSKEGALIFGGIDTRRFKGKLVKRPLVKDELGTFGPSIVLSGYGQTLSNGKKFKYNVPQNDSVFLLDTGNQYFRLRHSFVDPLYKDLGAVNDGGDRYYVKCNKRHMPGTWDFEFGEVTIKVPYKSLITELSPDNGKHCQVGVLTTWKGQLVLGQPFLQAAYAAFDLDNKQVALAPSADCGQNIVAFGSGPNAIPELTGC
ncbi:putative aspartic-type endopeptidase OPSB 3 [Colletotrichum chlorophyti]|uniref:Putative aspartic-type endopeptidase OPSB 3 n=1 Tax=Colletotrichum chlorophyti TaxID=708187 RepID=A0A1Q8S6G6_9PEZI|nr:putative aspartic-type endopeptidase OPSB 3 [Colletotrichum chlorophyti]